MKLVLRLGLMMACGTFATNTLCGQSVPMASHHTYCDPGDATFQLVFFSVLEGCLQDGLSDADVDQILRQATLASHPEHFIYGFPICTATQLALESYRGRAAMTMMKVGGKVAFGGGLTSEMHARLYSTEAKTRLSAIHDLVQNWTDRRVASLRLDAQETAQAQRGLKAAREEGMRVMQASVQRDDFAKAGSAYHEGDECAICNAAAGMNLKLAADH